MWKIFIKTQSIESRCVTGPFAGTSGKFTGWGSEGVKTHISPFHTSTTRPSGYNEHNQTIIIHLLLQLTCFYDFDLVSDLLWTFVPHDLQTLCFSVKNIVLQWTQSKGNYKSLFYHLTHFYDLDLVRICCGLLFQMIDKLCFFFFFFVKNISSDVCS